MEKPIDPKVIEANRSDNGVIVGFADGKNAFYSAALLYEMLDRAEEIHSEDDEK